MNLVPIYFLIGFLVIISVAFAEQSGSTNYNISSEITGGGGTAGSGSYNLSEASGQAIINETISASFNIKTGIISYGSNLAPTLNAVLNNDNPITLTACENTIVVCNGTVDDGDGYGDINFISAVIYHSSSTPGAADDPNIHYTNSSCEISGGYATTKKDYTCTFNMAYFSNNGTWTCNVTAIDFSNAQTTQIDTETVNLLKAVNVYENSVNYGVLEIGQTTTNDKNTTIQNCGNIQINVNLSGSDMSCTLNAIPVTKQRYNVTKYNAGYSSMANLTSTPTYSGLTVFDTQVSANITGNVYWALQVPEGVSGACSGNITFLAY